jgi:hypothetical protein
MMLDGTGYDVLPRTPEPWHRICKPSKRGQPARYGGISDDRQNANRAAGGGGRIAEGGAARDGPVAPTWAGVFSMVIVTAIIFIVAAFIVAN